MRCCDWAAVLVPSASLGPAMKMAIAVDGRCELLNIVRRLLSDGNMLTLSSLDVPVPTYICTAHLLVVCSIFTSTLNPSINAPLNHRHNLQCAALKSPIGPEGALSPPCALPSLPRPEPSAATSPSTPPAALEAAARLTQGSLPVTLA